MAATAMAPAPVAAGAKSRQGPNKILLIVLGLLAAVALFIYVIQPVLFGSDSKEAPAGDSSASVEKDAGSDTAKSPQDVARDVADEAGETSKERAGESSAPGTTAPDAAEVPAVPEGEMPPAVTDPSVSDSAPVVDPAYASPPRDPFAPLPGEESSAASE